jgi:hypothetical protein
MCSPTRSRRSTPFAARTRLSSSSDLFNYSSSALVLTVGAIRSKDDRFKVNSITSAQTLQCETRDAKSVSVDPVWYIQIQIGETTGTSHRLRGRSTQSS